MIHEFRDKTVKFYEENRTINYTDFIKELKKIKDKIEEEKKQQKLGAAYEHIKNLEEDELREFVGKFHKCVD